ncbi:glycosyltransferase family 4 protein [Modestobacter sp. VKM Ac-2977]|uniref:glycosyltransferase family 4 protein n=1 Tax=Modestobacter sp. VKM Ac-2977 TaxID=3004131 RepID=UPI0022AA8C96|nr:glycosyltransferase family 4 protein [Modestobacter sp. VKM Ac-2977]MCZ2822755.1 glycosyltransferase family 4 protein [Modestobacter sp. VKM Ac-2977]
MNLPGSTTPGRRSSGAAEQPLLVYADPAFRTQQANPYNAMLYQHLIARGVPVEELTLGNLLRRPPRVVHVHWPELTYLSGRRWRHTGYRIGTFLAALALARLRRGTALVWTVHNLQAHERDYPALQSRLLWAVFPRLVDGFLTLTPSAQDQARAVHPALRSVPGTVTPHGDYRAEVDRSLDRAAARHQLGIEPDVRLLLFVGQVRAYKNVPALIDSFSEVADADARLVVAGQARQGVERDRVIARAARDPRVRTELEFQTPERLSAWLAAADVVVLPYTAVLNSGTALLALSADRPVVAPRMGAIGDLQDAVGRAWVHAYDGELDEAVRAALRMAAESRPEPVDLSAFAWPRIAELTEGAYRGAVARRRSRGIPSRIGRVWATVSQRLLVRRRP